MAGFLTPIAPAAGAGYVPGRYYALGEGVIIASVAVSAPNRLLLYQFELDAPMPVASLIARVIVGGAGSAMKAGIWRNANARPVGPPVLADNVGASTAATGIADITASGFLAAGRWWGGAKFSATVPTMLAWHGSALGQTARVGSDTALLALNNGATNQVAAYYLDGETFADDLPDLTGATLTAGGLGCPVLGAKVAA